MAASLKLVSHHLCPYVQRAVIALTEKGVAHERVYVDLADKPQWFRDISPLGKVPLLVVGDDVLFESAVICEYLDDTMMPRLHPENALERAQHRAWIEFGSAILNDIWSFYTARDEAALTKKRDDVASKFQWLERHLGEGRYFAGSRFHLVDAVFGPIFRYFDTFEAIADFDFFKERPKVRTWRAALSERPSVRDAVTLDYPERLRHFLRTRQSQLSAMMAA
ncbi:MAG TPA: glutathione S-transferase family protein [Stellaceae bacterium]|nr:glutathione S-transferase family protein [Stellaceae bacterium]